LVASHQEDFGGTIAYGMFDEFSYKEAQSSAAGGFCVAVCSIPRRPGRPELEI